MDGRVDRVVCGVWCVVCGVWCVVCGVWCGVWMVDRGCCVPGGRVVGGGL